MAERCFTAVGRAIAACGNGNRPPCCRTERVLSQDVCCTRFVQARLALEATPEGIGDQTLGKRHSGSVDHAINAALSDRLGRGYSMVADGGASSE